MKKIKRYKYAVVETCVDGEKTYRICTGNHNMLFNEEIVYQHNKKDVCISKLKEFNSKDTCNDDNMLELEFDKELIEELEEIRNREEKDDEYDIF
jgi:hypothetical protein